MREDRPSVDWPSLIGTPDDFAEVEILVMERALKKTKGNIAAAARLLNVDRSKVYRR